MKKKVALCLDIIYIIIILLLIVLSVAKIEVRPLLSSILLIIIGIAFVCSKKLRDIFLVAKIFYWVSCNIFVPRLKINHIIWGILPILLGLYSMLSIYLNRHVGIEGNIGHSDELINNSSWWYKDPLFWIVILLLIIIGLYRSRRFRERTKTTLKK